MATLSSASLWMVADLVNMLMCKAHLRKVTLGSATTNRQNRKPD